MAPGRSTSETPESEAGTGGGIGISVRGTVVPLVGVGIGAV